MNEEEFLLLLRDINQKMDSPLADESLRLVFNKWWPDISAAYAVAQKRTAPTANPVAYRSDRELLEEVLERVRAGPQSLSSHIGEANDTLNAAQALLRIIRARPAEEIAFLHRINLLKNLQDHDAVEAYAEMHAKVSVALQNAGLLWRSGQERLVMNRVVGESVLPMMLEAPLDAPEQASQTAQRDA